MGVNKLSDRFSGLLVTISKTKKANAKIKAQIKPIKKMQIKNAVKKPASAPSHVLFLFHKICFLPNLIPI